jgi:hypothetical protein
MLENELRDLLAGQLEVLESGLRLEEIEKYIPNNLGTKSFIDLLAVDTGGRWVLIEIKRSDSAARQAIHEVLKYVEGVKQHLGTRDDEIRVMVVSTEWDELLVPYSRFIKETSISITGFKLEVDQVTKKIFATAIDPLPLSMGRVLSPWHELNLYTTKKGVDKSIEDYDASCRKKSISNYVMVILEAPEGHHQKVVERTRHAMAQQQMSFGGEVDHVGIARSLEKMAQYGYVNYFVPQLQTKSELIDVLTHNNAVDRELRSLLDGMEEEEALCHLQELVLDLAPKPKRDYFEIGYAAKFNSRLLEDEGWKIVKVLRRGTFERNSLLTDKTILSEISGDTGITGQRYKRRIELFNRAQISSARKDIDSCLGSNPVWRTNVLNHLDDIVHDYPNATIEINIYNPMAGMFTLFFTATRDDGFLYWPQYLISVDDGGIVRAYWGELSPEGSVSSFNEVIQKLYDGEVFGLLLEATQGYRCSRDSEVLEALGLVYCSYRKDFDATGNEDFCLTNGSWRSIAEHAPFQNAKEYFEKNEELVAHIVAKIGRRQLGGMFDGSSTDGPLAGLVDEELAKQHNTYFINPPDKCDLCGLKISEDNFFIDGQLKRHSAWANMCADCFASEGLTIGWGTGQLYRRENGNNWLLVAGFPPQLDDQLG